VREFFGFINHVLSLGVAEELKGVFKVFEFVFHFELILSGLELDTFGKGFHLSL
jgi:hypothetical protein